MRLFTRISICVSLLLLALLIRLRGRLGILTTHSSDSLPGICHLLAIDVVAVSSAVEMGMVGIEEASGIP